MKLVGRQGAKGCGSRLARMPVWMVAVMGVVVPRSGVEGLMVQVLLVGAPVQAKVTLPVTVVRELRSSE